MNTQSLISHLEMHLGEMDEGWRAKYASESVQVARFNDRPSKGDSTFVTLGLSHHVLQMPSDREVRQELVFAAHDDFDAKEIASFLLTFSQFILANHEALLRGQVVGLGDRIFQDAEMNAVYSAIPILFDDSFATFQETSPPTVFVWLLPLYASEARFVQQHGWDALEDLFVEKNPDLLDLRRQPVA